MKIKVLKFEYPSMYANKYAAMCKKHWWNRWWGLHEVMTNMKEYDPKNVKKFYSQTEAVEYLLQKIEDWEEKENYPIITTIKKFEV